MPYFNPYYIATVVIVAAGGIPKGYDEGGFSASITLPSFVKDFGLTPSLWKHDASGLASRTADITSFGVLGAALGALIALAMADRFGRLRCWQFFVTLWASGLLMQIFSSGILGFLFFARIWGGFGAGGLTVVAPLYLSEIAPAKSRGMIISIFMVLLLSFLSLGFFINYGADVRMAATRTQYRLVQSIPLIPVGIAFIFSFFLSETPRWLASKDRSEEALAQLARLRGANQHDERLSEEYKDIQAQIRLRHQSLKKVSTWMTIREVATTSKYRERLLLGIVMNIVAQWSGGNGITYYIPQIFKYAGVVGNNTSLITSGAYGITKLVFTLVFTWGLIDVFGRRRCMLTGLALQCIAYIWMAIYTGVFINSKNESASDAAIAAVYVYAVGWSIGLCTIPYLYCTEIYPTHIRGVCYAINMCLHWFFQFAVVRVTPNMFVSLDVWGVYVFFGCICAIGFCLLGIWAPETKGVPMEWMEDLFADRWWRTGRAKVVIPDHSSPERSLGDGKEEAIITSELERV